MNVEQRLRRRIRDVPDFPKKGILFRDLTPVLEDSALFAELIDALVAPWKGQGITRVAAIESRGFLFGAPMALALKAGMSLIRKAGKLPHRTLRKSYALEYGEGVLEVHADTATSSDRAVVVDDLLATGGTAAAAAQLLRDAGAQVVGYSFVVELGGLEGRKKLDERVEALLRY